MPTTKGGMSASRSASIASSTDASSRQYSPAPAQQLSSWSHCPSSHGVQRVRSQVFSSLQFGPPSVASSTYLSPSRSAPRPSVKYSRARASASAVGVPPPGGVESRRSRILGTLSVPASIGMFTADAPPGTSQQLLSQSTGMVRSGAYG